MDFYGFPLASKICDRVFNERSVLNYVITVFPPFALEYKEARGKIPKPQLHFGRKKPCFYKTTTFEPNCDGAIEYLTTFKGS